MMPPAERARWYDLLSYIGAMIYHERGESEQAELHETIERSLESEELRREVRKMGKTMAEVLTERGRTEAAIETRQQTLLRQLRKRFGDVSSDLVRIVESTTDVEQLDTWLDRFATARTLEELEIER